MRERQDSVAPRTVQDIERKYSFGKRFSEILGLIEDTRDTVDSVETSLSEKITKTETSLRRDTTNIVAEAKQEVLNTVDGKLESERKTVEAQINADALRITALEEKAEAGAEKVVTKTGFTFDADGLKISKTGEEMENLLDNTGMYVNRAGTNVLTANKDGVTALNTHIKTYLTIGAGNGRSRFEDYGTSRTGCFWIGG